MFRVEDRVWDTGGVVVVVFVTEPVRVRVLLAADTGDVLGAGVESASSVISSKAEARAFFAASRALRWGLETR